jgi:hypothetical protein
MMERADCGQLLQAKSWVCRGSRKDVRLISSDSLDKFDDQKNSFSSLVFGVLNELSGAPKVAIISSSS